MVKQYKVDEVSSMVAQLKEKGNIILTNYSGIRVKDLGKLRKTLRSKNADYRVVKNTLFKRALKEMGIEGLDEFLKGPIAVAFTKDDVGDIAKALKDFAKDVDKFSYTAGYLDNVLYDQDQIKRIADLPSKEVVLAQLMGMVNAPARGIKAVAEANNKQ